MDASPAYLAEACRINSKAFGFIWKYKEKESKHDPKFDDWVELKEIPGYKISKEGEVYSTRVKRCLKPFVEGKRRNLTLRENGVKKKIAIYRLVARAYIPNPNNYRIVNHLDGNSMNDNVTNLEWCTKKRDIQHAYEMGLHKNAKALVQIDMEGNEIEKFFNISDASRKTGHSRTTLRKLLSGKRESFKGFRYKYVV